MSDVFSPYQIDYSVKNTSKTFGFSKKKITFKFGVANPPAVANGETGANCRGSEHEVIFIWSLNSGKRQILADGKDVHFSETGQNGWTADQVFQHHFQIRVAGLAAPLRAHLITQPANKDVPHIKPFDLRLNGISYFGMPRIYELGGPRMITRPVKGGGKSPGRGSSGGRYRSNEDDAYLSPAEREAIAAAKLASIQDLSRPHHAPAPAAPVVEDLISFDAPAPTAPPAAAYGQQQPPPPQQIQTQYRNYSVGSAISSMSSPQYSGYAQQQQPAVQQPQYSGYAATPQQAFAGQQQGSFYGQQPPPALAPAAAFDPHQAGLTSPSNQSMSSYQSYGSAPSFAQPPQQQYQQPPQQQQQGYYGQQPQGY